MKKSIFISIVNALLVLLLFSASFAAVKTPNADYIYINGNIYTVDSAFSRASVLAVSGDKLIYVGEDKEAALRYAAEKTQVVDLGGKTVVPGLIDGHMHFLLEGEQLTSLPIYSKSKAEILELVNKEAARLKPGEWITGDGWNQETWQNKAWPTKEELDAVSPRNPVALGRIDRHAVWVNSLALSVTGITAATPNPQGGEILKDARGQLLGILTDTASARVLDKMPPLSPEMRYAALLKAQEELFANGITSIVDAGASVADIDLMRRGYERGDLRIRAYVMLNASTGQDIEYINSGHKPEREEYGNRLSVAAVKIFSDGSLGSRGAWLINGYADRPGHNGSGRYSDEEIYSIIKRARAENFQVGVHAIGDAAVRQTINAMERVLKEQPLADHRYRIEHFQVVQPEDITRAIKDGIIPAMQSIHAASDLNMAEARVGPELVRSAYAWRSVLDAGGIIANGSDAPVEPVNPYHGIYAAVARTELSGNPKGGWFPEQKMTREEALKSFTIWPAFAQFEEKLKGSLEVGKLADFVVLDRDIMTCPESEIKDAEALMTVVGGRVEFTRGGN